MKEDPKPTYAVLLREKEDNPLGYGYGPHLILTLAIVTIEGQKILNPPGWRRQRKLPLNS